MAFILCKKNEHAWKIELQRTADGGGVFTGWLYEWGEGTALGGETGTAAGGFWFVLVWLT